MGELETLTLPQMELYLHIPFCHSRCHYCDFATQAVSADDPLIWAYGQAMISLVMSLKTAAFFGGHGSVYVGGGTPTVLGALLPELVATTTALERFCPYEITVEANPESITPALLRSLKNSGATRVSMGVQATQPKLLQKIGRLHDAAQALNGLKEAASLGFHCSADLLAGLPWQKRGDLTQSIQRLVTSGAQSISVYALEVYDHTPLGRLLATGHLHLPSEDETADFLEEAQAALAHAGFEHYEISNWALPGFESRHNLGYWHGVPYLGLGPSAASMLSRETYQHLCSYNPTLPPPPSYIERLRLTCTSSVQEIIARPSLAALSFRVEGLTAQQSVAEDLMLAVRCKSGIGLSLQERARSSFGQTYCQTVERLCSWGLLRLTQKGALAPTQRGWFMGNTLSGELWDLANSAALWNP